MDAKKAEELAEENKNAKVAEEVKEEAKKTPFDEPGWENLDKVNVRDNIRKHLRKK